MVGAPPSLDHHRLSTLFATLTLGNRLMSKKLTILIVAVLALAACEPTGRYRNADSERSPSYGNSIPSGHSH